MWRRVAQALEKGGLGRDGSADLDKQSRRALVEAVLRDLEAGRRQNADFARALVAQLAGNSGKLDLSEMPDGLGNFYGRLQLADQHWRIDVLPPRALWTGDMGAEHADPVDWVVFVDGEEIQRAPSIEALQPLAPLLEKRSG